MSATMYPSELLEFDERSKEDLIYKALRDGLTPEYHAFHSVQIRHVDDSAFLREKEIDFLIYHREKGILCLEAKYCDPSKKREFGYVKGRWQYSNGLDMKYGSRVPTEDNGGGGPFMQAKNEQLAVRENVIRPALEEKCKKENPQCFNPEINDYCDNFFKRFKILYGVWFHGLTQEEINKIPFPPEASKDLVLSLDDLALGNTKKAIDNLFSFGIGKCSTTDISDAEHEWLLHEVLCPKFNIRVSRRTEKVYDEIMYSHLLHEQLAVLYFLEGQRSAAINGLAGTGKTFVAMEWARRCVERKERVLFLCFNSALKDFLEGQFRLESSTNSNLIDFRTFVGYLGNNLGVKGLDVKDFNELLQRYEDADRKITELLGRFPYQHVIVDEGQDCALSYIDNSHFVDDLKEVTLYDSGDGKHRSFYLFYDQHQIVAGRGEYTKGLPRVIQESDAKLTLYKNCRNTRSIATVSTKGVLGPRQPLVMANGVSDGVKPEFYCIQNEKDAVECAVRIASSCRQTFSPHEIVILSCDQTGLKDNRPVNSIAKSKVSERNGKLFFNGVYEFSTYRKFKGLDRAVVILVDVGVDSFIGKQACMPFYEASSRARQQLFVVSSLTEGDCEKILKTFQAEGRIQRDPDCEKAYACELIEDHLGGVIRT